MNIIEEYKSTDGISIKYVQKTFDGYAIETEHVNRPEKHIICYSTQIGCNNGCMFCYSGLQHDLRRDLLDQEIVNQCVNVYRKIGDTTKPVLFSAMGIGDPLNNFRHYVRSLITLSHMFPDAKFAAATCGVPLCNITSLTKFVREINFKLTASLHSANPDTKRRIMPYSPLPSFLIDTCKGFQQASGKEVEYNITLMNGINDSDAEAYMLIDLLSSHSILNTAHIKINKFNHVNGCNMLASSRVQDYIDILRTAGVDVEYYETNGSDINGACGQMAARKIKMED